VPPVRICVTDIGYIPRSSALPRHALPSLTRIHLSLNESLASVEALKPGIKKEARPPVQGR
jgi:hypothetical protein